MRGREDDELLSEESDDVDGGGLEVSALDPLDEMELDPLDEIELDVSDIV